MEVTTLDDKISATATASGAPIDYGSASYDVNVTSSTPTLTFSNPTGGTPNIFSILTTAQSTYYKAVDSSGNRSAVEIKTATPDSSIAKDTTPPANVTSLSATAGNEAVTLTCTNPNDSDLAFIEITWTSGGTTPETVFKGAQTYIASSLAGGTEYTFTVKAVDSSTVLATGTRAKPQRRPPTASVKKITFTDIPGEATGQEASIAIASSLADLQAGVYVASGSGTISGASLTITLQADGSGWIGSGVFYIGGWMGERSSVYTNGGTTPVAYTISSETSTISVKQFIPFVGTWTGTVDSKTTILTIKNTGWKTVKDDEKDAKGTYTLSDDTATVTLTHKWEDSNWKEEADELSHFRAMVSCLVPLVGRPWSLRSNRNPRMSAAGLSS
jgi:hypothetical protein